MIKVNVSASITTGKGLGLHIIGLSLIIVSINRGTDNRNLNHSGKLKKLAKYKNTPIIKI